MRATATTSSRNSFGYAFAAQIETGILTLGEITDAADLAKNLTANAIPAGLASVTAGQYPDFLNERRKLMAAVIHNYHQGL